MTITFDNKAEVDNLYLHDFNIKEFTYSDIEKSINIKAISNYIKKEIYFKFLNVLYCEITGEKIKGGIDIIDWYELTDYKVPYTDPFFDADYQKTCRNFKPIGIGLLKASGDTIKIYCEKIEVEEQELQN